MTFEIAIVFAITALAVLLFIIEWVRVDVVALMVLGSLALTGLVTPMEAISGFSNPAVVTVWAVLILSAALSRTGVAGLIGHRVLRLAGNSEGRLITIIMLTVASLSGFMNDIGVATLFLPVVLDTARRIKLPPSKLLIPLAFAALLGGLITLIGTPPNILISEALRQSGLVPFGMFDYTPVGIVVMLAGVLFMVLIGRHLLPNRDIAKEFSGEDYKQLYDLGGRMGTVQLPHDSALAGKTLAQSRLGSALGLNVIAIIHNGQTNLAPGPDVILQPGDKLLVEGRLDQLADLHGRQHLTLEEEELTIEKLVSADIELVEIRLAASSTLIGQTLRQTDFRQRFGVIVLSIQRANIPRRTNLENFPLQPDDVFLVQGTKGNIDILREDSNLLVSKPQSAEIYNLEERLMVVGLTEDSSLVGKSLTESRLGDAFGLGVLGIVREGKTYLMPQPEDKLMAGDTLLVKGKQEDLLTIEGLQNLEIDAESSPELIELESEDVGLIETVLSPHTTLVGKTLRELHFRVKYGLSVLAIFREGQAYRSNLRDEALRFGDALLLYGPREKFIMLGSEPDFLVLTEEAQEAPRRNKALISVLVMAAVLIPVILGWVHIAIAAVAGVVLMILTGCLTIEEAHRAIEWKAIFLIAGMIPLGIAMEKTGAASFLAQEMVNLVGGWGPAAVMAGLFILAALASQVMPNPAVAVLLAPIALNTAGDLGISPYPLLMAVAVSASAAFLSPVGHSANIMVMGPGGYRFSDYIKVGLPLTLIVLLVVMVIMPIFWPFY
ncbi:MAG: SLC13 family permease [Chloroflexota bacterium]|nr:MAG: SLC13 family permease [Chloroflexota bacterium]